MGGHGEHGHDHHPKRLYNPIITHMVHDEGHHVAKFECPDWRIYKVENAPDLLKVQERLAAMGIKDPWLRNHVWRYDPQFGYLSPAKAGIKYFTTGMKYGFAAFVASVALVTGYQKFYGVKDGHGKHH